MKTIKTIAQAISLISLLFGMLGIGGAIENGTNFVIPIIMVVAGIALLKISGGFNEDEDEIDYLSHH